MSCLRADPPRRYYRIIRRSSAGSRVVRRFISDLAEAKSGDVRIEVAEMAVVWVEDPETGRRRAVWALIIVLTTQLRLDLRRSSM